MVLGERMGKKSIRIKNDKSSGKTCNIFIDNSDKHHILERICSHNRIMWLHGFFSISESCFMQLNGPPGSFSLNFEYSGMDNLFLNRMLFEWQGIVKKEQERML